MKSKIKWAFLCSSWGRNAKDVNEWHTKNGQINKIGLVVYESKPCGTTKTNSIEHLIMTSGVFKDKSAYHDAILALMKMDWIINEKLFFII